MKALPRARHWLCVVLAASLPASLTRADVIVDGVNVGTSYTTSGDQTSATPAFLIEVTSANGGADTVTVSAGDTLRDNDASTFVIRSGATLTTLDNRGAIIGNVFNAINLSSGGTITTLLNSGTIQGEVNGNAGAFLGGPVSTLTNTGTISHIGSSSALIFNDSTSVSNIGSIVSGTGHGVLIGFSGVAAVGLFTNDGTISTTGASGVEAVQLGDGVDADVVTSFVNNGTIRNLGAGAALSVNANTTITNGITHTGLIDGTVALSGATLNLSGASSRITGAVSGSVASVVNVGGTFASESTFSVGTLNVTSGGRFDVGHDVTATTLVNDGTLSVSTGAMPMLVGDFQQGGTGIFRVGADGTGQSGRLAATGAATLGGTVQVDAGSGTYAPTTAYTILTAGGGLTGTFSGVTSNLAFLTPSLDYDANSVFLVLARSVAAFADAGQTPNQQATGLALDALGSGAVYDAFTMLSAAQAPDALDSLSGELHATAQNTVFDSSRLVRDALIGHLRRTDVRTATPRATSAKGPPAERARTVASSAAGTPDVAVGVGTGGATRVGLSAWTQALGEWGHQSADRNSASMDSTTGGVMLGMERAIGARWRAGVAGGYTRTALEVDARRSSGTVDRYLVGAYGEARLETVALRFGASRGWRRIDTRRRVSFPGYEEQVAADYRGSSWQGFAEAEGRVTFGSAALEPFVGLDWLRTQTGGFREAGGAGGAALSARGRQDSWLSSTLGLRTEAAPGWYGPRDLLLHGTLGWRHTFGGLTPDSAFAFEGGASPSFRTHGLGVARDLAQLEAGFELHLGEHIRADVVYTGQLGAKTRSHAVWGTLSVRF